MRFLQLTIGMAVAVAAPSVIANEITCFSGWDLRMAHWPDCATPQDEDDMPLTDALRNEYLGKFTTCVIKPGWQERVGRAARRVVAARDRYDAVSRETAVPWYVIAVIHQMECGGKRDPFGCHLHNGDSLLRRTVRVPRGRPADGKPPFSWETSAVDALRYQGLHEWGDWSLAGTLYQLELYNGTGYRKRMVPTPYLWSGSQHDLNHDGRVDATEAAFGYVAGKYVADGRFDPKAVSEQVGSAVIIRRLVDLHEVALPELSVGARDAKCEGMP